jgi:hypothetical protein
MNGVVDRLLEGDVAVRFQTWRGLLSRFDVDMQERIAREGQGAHCWRRGRMVIGARASTGRCGRQVTKRCSSSRTSG